MKKESTDKAVLLVELLDSTRSDIATIVMGDTDLATIALRVDNGLQIMSNQVKSILGMVPDSQGEPVVFGPLTHLDGEIGQSANEVTDEDLTILPVEVNELKEKVLKFEASLGERTDAEVLAAIITTDDQLVIRGLAKKAGVEGFQDAAIDESFVVAIRAGLAGKVETTKADKSAIIAQIKAAETKEEIEALAKGNDDPEIQDAAIERIIEIEG